MPLPTLRTTRLLLRHVTEEDADALFGIFGDHGLTRYWGHPPLASRAAASAYVEEIEAGAASGELLQWGITSSEGELIGTCTLSGVDQRHHRAELGVALGRAHHGRGLAREAVGAVLQYGFEHLGLHRVTADVDPRNAAARRLVARFGFIEEGRLREHYRQHGQWQDGLLFGLLRREWNGTEV